MENGWARQMCHVWRIRKWYKNLVERLKGRDYSEKISVGGDNIKTHDMQMECGLICLGIGTGGGLL
jgi:hypothetical protein